MRSRSSSSASWAGVTSTGAAMTAFTRMPIAAPMAVSTIRSIAYSGVLPPMASTSIAVIAI